MFKNPSAPISCAAVVLLSTTLGGYEMKPTQVTCIKFLSIKRMISTTLGRGGRSNSKTFTAERSEASTAEGSEVDAQVGHRAEYEARTKVLEDPDLVQLIAHNMVDEPEWDAV